MPNGRGPGVGAPGLPAGLLLDLGAVEAPGQFVVCAPAIQCHDSPECRELTGCPYSATLAEHYKRSHLKSWVVFHHEHKPSIHLRMAWSCFELPAIDGLAYQVNAL
jgi:hypothetical protein